MNTNMTGFKCFSKKLSSCALDESGLSSGRFNIFLAIFLMFNTAFVNLEKYGVWLNFVVVNYIDY